MVKAQAKTAPDLLDQYVQRLQNIDPFHISSITDEGKVAPWYDVTGEIVGEVVVKQGDLETQIRAVPGQIAQWGRLHAQACRVAQIEERKFVVWKAQQYLAGIEAAGDKKPSDKILEAKYRVLPEYDVLRNISEKAEEAANATYAILEAFKAKRDALSRFARSARDQNGPTFVV